MNLSEAKKDTIGKAEFNDAINDFSTVEIMRIFIQILDKYNLVDVKIKQSLMNDARSMDTGNFSHSIYFTNDTPIDIRLSGKSGTVLRLRFKPELNKLYYKPTFIYNRNGESKKQELDYIMDVKPIHTTNKTTYDVFDEVFKFLAPIIEVDPDNLYDYFKDIRRKRYNDPDIDKGPKLKGVDLIMKTLLKMHPIFKKNYSSNNTIEIESNNEFFHERIGKPIRDAGLEIGVYLDEFRFSFQRKEFQKLFNTLVEKMKNMDYYVDLIEITKHRVRITYNYFEDGKDAYYTRVERKKNDYGETGLYHTKTYGKGDHYHKQQIIKDFNKLKKDNYYNTEINDLEDLEAHYMLIAWKMMEGWNTK